MDNRGSRPVAIGQIVFRSWEHEWVTGERHASSVSTASRVLPKDVSEPIYSLLERLELLLLRESLPFPPYGLRIAQGQDVPYPTSQDQVVQNLRDQAVQYLPIGHCCPTWDDNLRRRRLLLSGGPKTKGGKFGTTLEVPLAERRLCDFYEVKWESKFGTIELDQLLGRNLRQHA
jgi:hypothetical protein